MSFLGIIEGESESVRTNHSNLLSRMRALPLCVAGALRKSLELARMPARIRIQLRYKETQCPQNFCSHWWDVGKARAELGSNRGNSPTSLPSRVSTITPCVVEHRYQTTMRGSARTGQEWIAWNSVTGDMETSWVDSFHMNYGILVSRGNLDENQASVCGHYAVGPDHPDWKWRTDFTVGPSALTIVSYNVSPKGEAAKAIEVVYQRID